MRHVSLPLSSQRGVTLVELMVSVGIMAFVLAAIMTTMLSQNRLISEMGGKREAQSSARVALATMSRYLERAGYGIGPEFAFDFDWYDCSNTCSHPANCGQGCDPAQRDRDDRPDELVFMARNPEYFALPTRGTDSTRKNAWEVSAAGSSSVTLGLHGGDVIHKGQVLEVICPGGYDYAYVTAAATVEQSGALDSVTNVDVAVDAQVANDPFNQADVLGGDCFSSGLARAFAVDRYRFFVATDTTDPQHPRPFLYLDRGMDVNGDDAIDASDLIPVAADVEDLQVAYVMPDGTVHGGHGSTSQPSMAAPGTACSQEITDSFYRSYALFPCTVGDTRRTSDSAANIASVRISLVTRTPRERRTPSGASFSDPDERAPEVENHDPGTTNDGYVREVLTTTVRVPNLQARGLPLL